MKKPNKNAAGRQRAQRGGHSQADSVQLDHLEPVKAYINRGMSYTELEQYQTAINDYTMAIQLDPDDVMVYINRAWSSNHLGQYTNQRTDEACSLDSKYC